MKSTLRRIRFGAFLLCLVVVFSIIGFRILGDYSWLEATWMVVVTISTVGFGERSELTPTLQVFTICVILLGVSAAVHTIGGFIQLLLEGEIDRALGKRKMTKEISRLANHVIICGFGRLGQDLAVQLRSRSIPFVVIDQDADRVETARQEGAFAVLGDATAEEVMLEANLESGRALATALPSDADNVFIALTARDLSPGIQIIAKAEQETSCRKLRQAGADKIVMPHQVGARQMERMISRPTTADLFELFAEASHLEMELDEFLVEQGNPLIGTTLGHSKIRESFNLLVVAIKDRDGELNFNPSPTQTINDGDTLLLIGQVDDINRLKTTTRPA